MLHALNIVAAHGDDSTSQIVWAIAVLVLAAIGAIAGKIKEKAQKPGPRPPERPTETSESGEDYSVPRPRPIPPRPREPVSRPMPRVPRPPTRPGDKPIGIPRPAGRAPTPQPVRPAPPRTPEPRFPAERPTLRTQEPGPMRGLESAPLPTTRRRDRTEPVIAGTGLRQEAAVAAPPRKPGGVGRYRLTPARLREAIILREVLGPPVSMREGEHLF